MRHSTLGFIWEASLMAMKTVVALPGQGIGLEVVDAACELLMGTGLPLKILTPPQGNPLPDETKQAAREADGVLFGAAGPATSNVVSWLRWEMSAWAGVRPIRFYPGMRSPLADPKGIERIARFAVELARKRKTRGKAGKITCVTKSNVMPKTDGLYQEIVGRVVREAGGLEFEHFHVDDAARRLVRFPKSMDVVLCMNLYGDILSD